MEYSTVTVPKKIIVGKTVRTDLENAMEDIPQLCDEFFSQNYEDQIEFIADYEIICAYVDYEGDYTQSYTYMIGYQVTQALNLPEGLEQKELVGGKYAAIHVTGSYPDSLLDAWKKIWESNVPRAYTTDYEVYGADFTEENNNPCIIYLALKEDA